jgi:hypothetical protein
VKITTEDGSQHKVPSHESDGSRTHRWGPWLLAGGLYVALSLVHAWPVVRALSTKLPHDLGDPLLNTWILWRNAWEIPLTRTWWDAPAFYPTPFVFGLSELLLGLMPLTSPIQWLGGTPELAYNVSFLLSYPLAALAVHLLVHRITGRHEIAVLCGLAFGFSTLRTAHLAQLQLMWSWWMPLMLVGLHSYAEGKRLGLALFAGAWLMQGLSAGYYLIFSSVLAAAWIAWFMTVPGQRRRVLPLGGAWLVAAVPFVPVWAGYRHALGVMGLRRGVGEMEVFSADVASLFTAAPDLVLWGRVLPTLGPERDLFLGLTLTLLAIAVAAEAWRTRAWAPPLPPWRKAALALGGILACVGGSVFVVGAWAITPIGLTVARPSKPWSLALLALVVAGAGSPRLRALVRQRSLTGFYALMALAFWVLSLGPTPTLLNAPILYKAPFAWLMDLPGFENIRVPARFGMVALLCLIVVIGRGLVPMADRLGRFRSALLFCACLGVVIDGWGGPVQAYAPPGPPAFAVDARRVDAVVELPLGTPERDAAAQYRFKYHRVPVVNGYSGFAPPHYDVIRGALADGDGEGVLALRVIGRLWAIIDRHADQAGRIEQWVQQAEGTLVGSSDAEAAYILPRLACPAAAVAERRLPVVRLTIGGSGKDLPDLLDEDRPGLWMSGNTQQGGEYLVADLGAPQALSSIVLEQGAFAAWYPRALAVEGSVDGKDWKLAWSGSPVVAATCGALLDPLRVPIRLPVSGTARYIKVTQTGRAAKDWWALAGLAVMAPGGSGRPQKP